MQIDFLTCDRKPFITSFLFILFSGCTKDVYDPSNKIPGEGTNPFSKVTISSNFDWSMIQISHLTVQSFDPYDGTYNYLVEVFDKSPEDQDANLLATGVCSKKTFDKKNYLSKGVGSSLHTIDDPYRISSYRSCHLNTG